MSAEIIDYKARMDAGRALQRMDDHEDRCGERFAYQQKSFEIHSKSVMGRFSAIEARLWWFAGGLGSALLAVIILLLSKH